MNPRSSFLHKFHEDQERGQERGQERVGINWGSRVKQYCQLSERVACLVIPMSIMTDVWWEQVLNPVQNFQPNFKEIWGERTHWLFSFLGVKAIPIFSQFASFWLRGSTNDVYWFLEIYQCTSFLLSGQPKKGSKIWGPIRHRPVSYCFLSIY